MALATQCPHCGKRFRVAADQLKLRGGIVRCGACHEIFDGNATLIDLDALAARQAASAQAAPAPVSTETAPAVVPAVVPAQAGTHADSAQQQTSPEPESVAPSGLPEQSAPEEEPTAHSVAGSGDAEPIYTLDFDHTFDPFGILPKPAVTDEADTEPANTARPDSEPIDEPEPDAQTELTAHAQPTAEDAEPSPVAQPVAHLEAAEPSAPERAHHEPAAPSFVDARRIEPTFGLPVDEELIAAALPGHDDFGPHEATAPRPSLHAASAPLPMRESAPADPMSTQPRPPLRSRSAESKAARRSKLTPTKIAPPKLRAPEIDEPEFVKRSRQQEQSGKTRRLLLAVGSSVLLLVLAGQSVVTFRNVLAARYPGAKPALVSACAVLGCRVELPARIDNLTIEQGELTALGANTYSLATLLHNQESLVQAWPHIELTLTDTNDKPLVRRVFTPAEYLPQGSAPATGFAARAEQPVKLYFQLDQLKPSGYRIAIFYP
jgi:predicted Zn finger-like uncharacterized protein